jgi:serine/threonine protein kinase
MDSHIGPYRILHKLGEGGMGVVYAAEDERLRRTVAIKTIRDAGDSSARERFFREARAAASLTHPNVCQLFDIGDESGRPFLVMELLEGEPLSQRVHRGTLALNDAVQIALSVLTALDALHARGFIHRDLKPSNVFLTQSGVKLLDFGLARELQPAMLEPNETTMQQGSKGVSPLTLSGMIVGTPRYMAPEQLLGAPVDGRTDLFAIGAILFEMLTGNAPFAEENAMKLYHAICYEAAPNLAGSAAIAAINRIVHRAMAKRPDDRYQSAGAMAADLREVMMISDAGSPAVAHRVTRLIVLPLRLLRPDPEIDFLAHAIPEAITTSLAGVGSLIVRSPMTASRIDASDLRKIASEADVDVALTGTLLRSGEQIRMTSQLLEVPGGTVLWSLSSQATMSDIFDLQDTLTQRIVESLQLPLTEREARLVRGDVPATPRAHEFYLRAAQQGESPEGWRIAHDLYKRALDEDPRYAPAWARIARIHLLLGKYGGNTAVEYDSAESAARHALELHPDLPIAHLAYAQIEVATGRAEASVVRLLERVQRGTSDPAVFSGLVMALRYCGLLEQSAAAHELARQLDPHISTSVSHTYWMMGKYPEALATVDRDRDFGADEALVLDSMGRHDEALAMFEDRRTRLARNGALPNSDAYRILQGFEWFLRADERAFLGYEEFRHFPDPEGRFYIARGLVRIQHPEEAIEVLDGAVRDGFFCYPIFAHDPWLDPLRGDARFVAILKRADERMRNAQRAFDAHPGSRVLVIGGRS